MDAVQRMRKKATDKGTLKTGGEEIDYIRVWQAPKPELIAKEQPAPAKPKPAEKPSIVAVLP